MSVTTRFGLPLVDAQQASQEVTHNEAVLQLGALVGLTLDSVASPGNAPPGGPANGVSYLVGGAPTGAWSGHAGKIAVYQDGWYFVSPANGLTATARDTGVGYQHNGTTWVATGGGTATILVAGGMATLTGAKYVNARFTGLAAAGNVDVYTVPTGKRAAVLGRTLSAATGAGTVYVRAKIGGTYYPLITTSTSLGLTTPASAADPLFVLEAGEVLNVISGTAGGVYGWFAVLEFDNTAPLKSARLTAFSTGDNTLYTVPGGKTAMPVDNLFTAAAGSGRIFYLNNSGAPRNVSFHAVASGGSPGSTNLLKSVASATPGARATDVAGNFCLGAGDFLNVNVDAGTATQVAWVNVVEL
jgi:hypothetical protein